MGLLPSRKKTKTIIFYTLFSDFMFQSVYVSFLRNKYRYEKEKKRNENNLKTTSSDTYTPILFTVLFTYDK